MFHNVATTEFKLEDDGTYSVKPMTGPVPSEHVHTYNLNNEVWSTTFPGQTITSSTMNPMKIARMNHGCVSYNEGGLKIMVAGGVIKTSSGQFEVTDTVEVMNWGTKTWRTERSLPRRFTGISLIDWYITVAISKYIPRVENDQYSEQTNNTWQL